MCRQNNQTAVGAPVDNLVMPVGTHRGLQCVDGRTRQIDSRFIPIFEPKISDTPFRRRKVQFAENIDHLAIHLFRIGRIAIPGSQTGLDMSYGTC